MVDSYDLPLRKTMCGTCPFKAGSKYACLKEYLTTFSLHESRICHSTGSNGINKKTGLPEHICRGSRDIQLNVMANLGVISEATDAAWNETREAFGMKPTRIQDPVKAKRRIDGVQGDGG